jgi:2-oxoglutarate-Fe(II)-dependent oxygenase superfamily protein
MADSSFLDEAVLNSFSAQDFLAQRPFPWWNLDHALKPEAFERLHAEYPPLSLFDWHEGRDRSYGQRPHDRYYVAYRSDRYPGYDGKPKSAFPEVWQDFLTELETNDTYKRFVERSLGTANLSVRYTFHVAVSGSEVSPHVDKGRKVGTHIFYFNTVDDWDPAWGGATLVLAGKKTEEAAPDFADFTSATRVEHVGNRSFFFRNTDDAWHGVPPMTCPEGSYRRLFNVIFERADRPWRTPTRRSRMIRRARQLLPRS